MGVGDEGGEREREREIDRQTDRQTSKIRKTKTYAEIFHLNVMITFNAARITTYQPLTLIYMELSKALKITLLNLSSDSVNLELDMILFLGRQAGISQGFWHMFLSVVIDYFKVPYINNRPLNRGRDTGSGEKRRRR